MWSYHHQIVSVFSKHMRRTCVSLSRERQVKSTWVVLMSLRTEMLSGMLRISGVKSLRSTLTVRVPGALVNPPSSTARTLIWSNEWRQWKNDGSERMRATAIISRLHVTPAAFRSLVNSKIYLFPAVIWTFFLGVSIFSCKTEPRLHIWTSFCTWNTHHIYMHA